MTHALEQRCTSGQACTRIPTVIPPEPALSFLCHVCRNPTVPVLRLRPVLLWLRIRQRVQAHLRRLYTSARALEIQIDLTPRQLLGMLRRTLDVNGMREASGAYMRVVVSRGVKRTPSQDPRTTVGHPTIAILPEWKISAPEKSEQVCVSCTTIGLTHALTGLTHALIWLTRGCDPCQCSCGITALDGACERTTLGCRGSGCQQSPFAAAARMCRSPCGTA